MKYDKIIEKIAGLGVPGLILVVAISTSGLAGAAAITAALSTIGFGIGILAGIGVLGVSVLISQAIAKYGFEKIYESTLNKLIEKGETKEDIKNKISNYPISKSLKLKLYDLLDKQNKDKYELH